MTTTTMMISDLPEDSLREIVCKVPLKYMRKVRRTCQRWDNLSKSWIFRKMHMRNEAAREAGESRMVLIMGFDLHLISAVVADVDHPSIESKGKLVCSSYYDSYQRITKVSHCDVLLLCVFKDTFKLVVWNPYLGQRRWIEPPSYSYRDPNGWDRYRYAFGYDHEKKSHKILRFMNGSRPRHLGGRLLCYEMYDFDSNLWRTLDVGTPHWHIEACATGVPLNGNTYWLAKHRDSDYHREDSLICFDFTSETFGPLLPLPFTYEENREVVGLLSSLKGDKLSLMLQFQRPSELEIWVTDPNNMSWSKFFTVLEPEGIYFSYSGFFIDEEKKVAMFFDKSDDTRHTLNIFGEAGLIKQVDVDPIIERSRSGRHAHVCSYVASLVEVQIKKRVFNRKQRSKFEIRPCEQNKSRRLGKKETQSGHSGRGGGGGRRPLGKKDKTDMIFLFNICLSYHYFDSSLFIEHVTRFITISKTKNNVHLFSVYVCVL